MHKNSNATESSTKHEHRRTFQSTNGFRAAPMLVIDGLLAANVTTLIRDRRDPR